MQLVYFLIAAFDLAAISCGLHYSRQTIGVYRASIDEASFFDRQLASSGVIADTAAGALLNRAVASGALGFFEMPVELPECWISASRLPEVFGSDCSLLQIPVYSVYEAFGG